MSHQKKTHDSTLSKSRGGMTGDRKNSILLEFPPDHAEFSLKTSIRGLLHNRFADSKWVTGNIERHAQQVYTDKQSHSLAS